MTVERCQCGHTRQEHENRTCTHRCILPWHPARSHDNRANDAAEKLREHIRFVRSQGGRIVPDGELVTRLLQAALATERRTTVERIRERLETSPDIWERGYSAILDEVAGDQ